MKKVKLNYTKQGYSYIKCTAEDCFRWGGMAICDDCNKDMNEVNEEIYLIFILGRALCKDCFEKWKNDANEYEEDIKFQNLRHIKWYRAYGFEVQK